MKNKQDDSQTYKGIKKPSLLPQAFVIVPAAATLIGSYLLQDWLLDMLEIYNISILFCIVLPSMLALYVAFVVTKWTFKEYEQQKRIFNDRVRDLGLAQNPNTTAKELDDLMSRYSWWPELQEAVAANPAYRRKPDGPEVRP